MTPNTAITPYLTPTMFLQRFDYRLVSELVSDTGFAQSEAELQTDVNLAAVIMDACAIFESTMKQGGRYEPADIQNLLAFNGGVSVGANIVLRVISDVAMQLLRERRGQNEEVSESYKLSIAMMDDLRTGKLNLGFTEPDTIAGVISLHQLSQSDYWNERLLSSDSYFWGILPDRRYYY